MSKEWHVESQFYGFNICYACVCLNVLLWWRLFHDEISIVSLHAFLWHTHLYYETAGKHRILARMHTKCWAFRWIFIFSRHKDHETFAKMCTYKHKQNKSYYKKVALATLNVWTGAADFTVSQLLLLSPIPMCAWNGMYQVFSLCKMLRKKKLVYSLFVDILRVYLVLTPKIFSAVRFMHSFMTGNLNGLFYCYCCSFFFFIPIFNPNIMYL